MPNINELKQQIEDAQVRVKRAQNPKIKQQLIKYMHRLMKELKTCEFYLSGGGTNGKGTDKT